MKSMEIKKIVRESYGKIAREQKGCGCGTCGPDAREFAKGIGYSEKELNLIPEDANLGLSCGNPAEGSQSQISPSRKVFLERSGKALKPMSAA